MMEPNYTRIANTSALQQHQIEPLEDFTSLYAFYFALNGVIGSSICCIGILGNILNILVYGAMIKHTKSATTVFLLAIAMADLLVLIFYLLYDIVCIAMPPKPLLQLYDFTADQAGSFAYYLFYVWYFPANIFILVSNWSTVSVMAFRFIAIYFPLKAYRWCTPERARNVLLLISILAIASVIPECFTLKLKEFPNYGYIFIDTELFSNSLFNDIYFNYIEVVNSILPFITCFLLSALLIRALRKSDLSLRKTGNVTQLTRRLHDQRRISIMLLVIVTWFIICTIPSFVWRGMKYGINSGIITEENWRKLRGIADVSLILQHSANFIIYFISNNKYRKYFKHYFKYIKDKKEPVVSERSISSRSFRVRAATNSSLMRSLKLKAINQANTEMNETACLPRRQDDAKPLICKDISKLNKGCTALPGKNSEVFV